MIRSVASVMMMAALFVAAPAMAQSPYQQPAPSGNAPRPKQPAKPATTPSAPAKLSDPAKDSKGKETTAKFPEKVEKNLYATNDFRGKKAPAFKVEKWLGKEPVHKDKVMLIDFWATWCGPCKALIPELENYQAKFKDDLVVIGISDEPFETVQTYIKEKRNDKVGYSMAVDTKKTMSRPIDVKSIPHVIIIDSQGIVRWQGFPNDPKEPLTEAIIKQIIDADKAAHTKKTTADNKDKKDTKDPTTTTDPKKKK